MFTIVIEVSQIIRYSGLVSFLRRVLLNGERLSTINYVIHEYLLFYLLINPNRPFNNAKGVGGQPVMVMSTGMTFDTAPQLA